MRKSRQEDGFLLPMGLSDDANSHASPFLFLTERREPLQQLVCAFYLKYYQHVSFTIVEIEVFFVMQ